VYGPILGSWGNKDGGLLVRDFRSLILGTKLSFCFSYHISYFHLVDEATIWILIDFLCRWHMNKPTSLVTHELYQIELQDSVELLKVA